MSNSTFLKIKRTDKYLRQIETPFRLLRTLDNSSKAAEKLIVLQFTNIFWRIDLFLSGDSVNNSRCYAIGE
jgi:hypothetical protein